MRAIDCLIFDLDGTLIDSSVGVIDAVNYSLRMMNLPQQAPEKIVRYIGFPVEKMYADFGAKPVEELHHHFQSRAAQSMVASTVPLDGVDRTLMRLQADGYRMAIATTKIRPHLDGVIAKFGWGRLFETSVAADEVAAVKPAPDAFRLALRRLGASAGRALVVGDTINDVYAAHRVPVRVVAVESPYGGLDELQASRPDYFVRTLADLPGLLTQINNHTG
ncbi:MAG: HAD-IA family hydrolase [Candidatus Zixiibacteriota bacterium]